MFQKRSSQGSHTLEETYEKEECPNELAAARYEVISDGIVETVRKGEPLPRMRLAFLLHEGS